MSPVDELKRALLEILDRNGMSLSPATIAALEKMAAGVATLVDEHAKKAAEAAGDAAAASITTEDAAEAALRKS